MNGSQQSLSLFKHNLQHKNLQARKNQQQQAAANDVVIIFNYNS